MTKLKLVSALTAVIFIVPTGGSAATTPKPQACPIFTVSRSASAPVLAAMRMYAKRHGFTVRSARMSAPVDLTLYKNAGECQGTFDVQPLLKVPGTATELRFALAKIRYPGTDAQQPSPGTPYFAVAKIGGQWRVIKNEMTGDDFGHWLPLY